MHLLHKLKKVHLVLFLIIGIGSYLGLGNLAPSAYAQADTGQITVRVTDPNGAVVAGASVTARNVATGVAVPGIITNGEGIAILVALRLGLYEVTANATGFAPAVQRVQVTVGSRVNAEIQLSVQAQ